MTDREIVRQISEELDLECMYVDELPYNHYGEQDNEVRIFVVAEGDLVTGFCLADSREFWVPELISGLKALKYLDISDIQTSEFPSWIAGLQSLQELNISCTYIEQLPEWIDALSKLEKLYLDGTSIAELPESICNLSELKELHCRYTSLEKLPEAIGNLKKLKVLDLNSTEVANLPESIGNLSEQEVLHLDLTHIAKLPESFANLSGLKHLHLPLFIELPHAIKTQIEINGGMLERRDGFQRMIDGKPFRNIPCHSRRSIEELLNGEFPDNTAVISFRDVGAVPVDYSSRTDRVFHVELENIRATDSHVTSFDLSYVILTDELFPQLRELADFIRKALDDNMNIICQCETGFGRSTGCAAAIRFFRYEGDYFGDFYQYTTLGEEVLPNVHVYNRIFNALNEGPCLPNFARFRKECNSTDYFACQVYLRENTLMQIINDIDKLDAIDFEQVLYFIGTWQDTHKWAAGREFANIDSGSMPGWTSYYGHGESTHMNTYNAFHLDILYGLAGIGVDAKILESLIPGLYEFYNADEELRTNTKNYRDFKKSWQSEIDRWKGKIKT